MDLASLTPYQHRMTRELYERIVATGVFEGQRLELLHGVIVDMSPQSALHMGMIQKLTTIFAALVVQKRAELRVQGPIALTADSEPEPDLVLVPPGDYSIAHPNKTLLIIEVAVASLARDSVVKAQLYASALQPEYWVVDVQRRRILVHRNPAAGVYADIKSYSAEESVSCAAFADVIVAVRDLIPPQ